MPSVKLRTGPEVSDSRCPNDKPPHVKDWDRFTFPLNHLGLLCYPHTWLELQHLEYDQEASLKLPVLQLIYLARSPLSSLTGINRAKTAGFSGRQHRKSSVYSKHGVLSRIGSNL